MQDEVVWKINWDTFRIDLKVRCDKTISESCCSEGFLHPPQQVVLVLVTAFSKRFQQSLFNRNSLSNPSAGNTRLLFKGLGRGRGITSLSSSSHPCLLIPEDWLMIYFSRRTVLRASLSLAEVNLDPGPCSSPTSPEFPICKTTGSSGLISATYLLLASAIGSERRIWSGLL